MELRKRAVSAGLMAAVLMGGMVLAGCEDNVEVLRDPDIRVAKGMTWAWRPITPPAASAKRDADERPVVSRDVITPAQPQQHLESNRDWNTEANRQQLQEAIERALKSKGLVKVNDPMAADFLVDYHVAVKTRKATVGEVYPGWGWYGWGWGPPEVEYRTVRWHEGTFVLDLALRSPKKLAYRAISQKELKNKPTISPYQAEEAVNHLLKGLKVQ
ncbi:MAG TPA: DUF4136 domain-containing protein [Candidatus Sulfotelmatobacter sp.]|nr:DUF4136 domain-containing protein [Candidatus Sulfotelmatobacter sp.]